MQKVARRLVLEGLLGALPVGLAGGIIAGFFSRPAIAHALHGKWGGLGIGLFIGLTAGVLGGLLRGKAVLGAVLAFASWVVVALALIARFDQGS